MSLAPGTVVDSRFEVLDVIGQGGMGIVYRARQRDMERDVALKVLKQSLAIQPDKMKRFRREAQLVSKLVHPNIVRVYSVGFDHDNPYIAMEFLRGQQLSESLRVEGPVPWERALPLFIQLCDALVYAHEHSIIHRDIKPSNIVLQRDTTENTAVKLVDFGIAKSLSHEGEKLTQTEMVLGSVFYLSPGQFQGRDADASADIYSLGCTFFEMLSGKPPFVGDTIFDTIAKSTAESLPKVNDLNPDAKIPSSLQRLLEAMTAKDPAHRVDSAATVRRNLERIAAGTGLESNLVVPEKLTPKRSSRRRRTVAMVACATVVSSLICSLVAMLVLNPYHAGKVVPGYLTSDPKEREYVSMILDREALPGRVATSYLELADLYRNNGLYLESEYVALEGMAHLGPQAMHEILGLTEQIAYAKLALGEASKSIYLLKNALTQPSEENAAVCGHLLDAYFRHGQFREAKGVIDKYGKTICDGAPLRYGPCAIMWREAGMSNLRLGRPQEALAALHEFRKQAGSALEVRADLLRYQIEEMLARSAAHQAISQSEYNDVIKRVFVQGKNTSSDNFLPWIHAAELMICQGDEAEGFARAREFGDMLKNDNRVGLDIMQLEYARGSVSAIQQLVKPNHQHAIQDVISAMNARIDASKAALNDPRNLRRLPIPTPHAAEQNEKYKWL